MIHLYAFVAEPVIFDGLHGLDGAELDTIDCGAVHAVVSRHEQAVSPERDAVLDHGGVVEAVSSQVPTLPVRFGSLHADTAALRAAVGEQQAELADRMQAVAGHVEFVIRAPVEQMATVAPPPADGGRGRAYLEGRLAMERAERAARDAAKARLHDAVGTLAEQAAQAVEVDGPRGPEISYLVPTGEAPAFTAAAATICDGTDLVVGGPWAPYTFAAGDPGG